MAEVKKSNLLTEILAEAIKVGGKGNAPLTAERFIVAAIEKAAAGPKGNAKQADIPELAQLSEVLNQVVANLDVARKYLLDYIQTDKGSAFLDERYMKRMLDKASTDFAKNGELNTIGLLACIVKDPSAAIKPILPGNLEKEMKRDPSSKISEETADRIKSKYERKEEKKAEETVEPEEDIDVKAAMGKLVADVKRIRTELQNTVFGQDNAINVFLNGYFQANMRSMLDKKNRRPSATFLFAGPPGVGKTFLAETAAELLGLPFMRFDMSEYTDNLTSAQELAGYPRTYKEKKPGKATAFVKNNPKCVLLFDEIEKCCMEVIHLFLQLLDAGTLRDACMEEDISFKNVIVIMTTNAGKQLYEEAGLLDMSAVSRKVVIKALRDDINPRTGAPYFPAAICSRFASGNVAMFNNVSANFLRAIAKKEIQRHALNLKNETGMELQIDEKVYSALMFAEGASVDARTIRARAEAFFNDELYELLRLVDSGKVQLSIGDVEKIHISVDLSNAEPEVVSLFENDETPGIMVFADEDTVAACAEKLPEFNVVGAQDLASAIAAFKAKNVDMAILDLSCGAAGKMFTNLNIEDDDTPARDFFKFVRENQTDLPLYLLEGSGKQLTEEEKVSFTRQGVRGFLRVLEDSGAFAKKVTEIATTLYQQGCITKLAKANKLVSFETAQTVSDNGKCAEIKLFDFALNMAVDSEDNRNVLSNVSKPNVRFEDVIGAGEAKKELTFFVEYLKNPEKYMGTGLKAPRGVILYGPPGTGKTMLAKAMASEADVTFLAAEGNQFLKPYVGEGAQEVHKLFSTARKYAPAILFVDEIDAIAKERKGGEHASANGESTLTAFLTEMDGFASDPTKPVFVLAATNFDVEPGSSKSLDPALMRRFDRRVYVDLPNKEDRIKFLKMKIAKNRALQISEAQIDNIAMRSTGMSLANLDSAIELALRSAIRDGSMVVTDAILEEAFETFNNGEEKKWDASQLERTARHEAGHALLSWLSGETPAYLTIVARGNHGGYMQHAEKEGKGLYTKDELLALIRTSLGGRAAEIVYYGERDGISTGASGDLASATNTAQRIVCTYGMDDEFGLAVVQGAAAANGAMSVEVRASVNRILREQMELTVKLIRENKDKIDALVEVLLAKNHMNSAEIEQAITKGAGVDATT